jgi:mannose-6-phosphate isomerase-like protein (cupin superfamily)
MLNGWVDLVFEDGQKVRLQSGESLYIPGGLRHNEIGASRDLELLEISVPADMGTVACDPPEGWSTTA